MKNNNRRKKSNHIEDSYTEFSQESKKWFHEIPNAPNKFGNATEQILIELKEEAKICHNSETANYNIKNSKHNSTLRWMKTVMTKGTMSDRIASHTVAIQDDPVHNLDTIRNFVGMVKISKKNDGVNVIDTLTDLFLEDLLIPNRKLQAFNEKPLVLLEELSSGNAKTRSKILSIWFFEDQLKEVYGTFIDALNNASRDSIDSNKEKAIGAMYKLLAGNPEQEVKLLALIVNKLGDPSQKVASKAIYCLGQLLRVHSNMQMVVLKEVEKLLFRSNVSTKSQYYSLCFLSQFCLNHDENEMAERLIDVYFGFFKACVKKGDIDSRMMSALLMGVNRAFPYAKMEVQKISDHLDTIYRVVHVANFSVSLHALNLLYQVSDHTNNISDRFFSALYRKLLDPQLATTTRQAVVLNLIYKALMKDTQVNRTKAIVKRLLQLCLQIQPSFACGLLYLISQVLKKKNNVISLVQKGTSFTDADEEEKYTDAPGDLEVDTKDGIIKIDDNDASTTDDQFPDSEKNISAQPSDMIEEEEEKPDIKPDLTKINTSGWYHWNMDCKKVKKDPHSYNPFNRNPLYAGAEHTTFVELSLLKHHFHPTVSLYATHILNGEYIKYQGDPLEDFTLIKFLDRFVFKNPKEPDSEKKGAHPTFGQRKYYKAKGVKSFGVTSYNYLHTQEEKIPVDEKFLFMYLNKKYADRVGKKRDEDDESVCSEDFEEMLGKMGGLPKDDDDDLDFMNDIGDKLKKRDKLQNNAGNDTDDESEADDSDGFEAEESDEDENEETNSLIEDGDEELIDELESDDGEDLVFDDDDSEDEKPKKKFKGNKNTSSLFASAEEFATLLEEEGNSKRKPGSSNTFSQKDNAGAKQVNWEETRNRWISGYDKVFGRKKKKNFNRPKRKM